MNCLSVCLSVCLTVFFLLFMWTMLPEINISYKFRKTAHVQQSHTRSVGVLLFCNFAAKFIL